MSPGEVVLWMALQSRPYTRQLEFAYERPPIKARSDGSAHACTTPHRRFPLRAHRPQQGQQKLSERLGRDQRELARELQERVTKGGYPCKDDGALLRID